MSVKRLRWLGRGLALLAILAVFLPAPISDLVSFFVPPPVRMPGGDVTDPGVSAALEGGFGMIKNSERLHFIVQFRRELTRREKADFRRRLSINFEGPIPENAYTTSVPAKSWRTVKEALLDGSPKAIRIFGFRSQDKLPRKLGVNGSLDIPDYAKRPDDRVVVFIRFFDDVPIDAQEEALQNVKARQPDRRTIRPGPTGTWAISIPAANLQSLADLDSVRFVSFKAPPVVEDMDQARAEVGATLLGIDGTGTVIAQWEKCHPTITHADMDGRVTVVGAIPFWCRDWYFANLDEANDSFDVGEPIWADIDEDGTIDENGGVDIEVPSGAGPPPANSQWLKLKLYISEDKDSFLYAKASVNNAGIVQADDVALLYNVYRTAITPVLMTGNGPPLREFIAKRHPTLVAGIMISNSESTKENGIPKYVGMASAARIRSHVWTDLLSMHEYRTAIVAGARISNHSFGFQKDYHFLFDGEIHPDDFYAFKTNRLMSNFLNEVSSGRDETGAPSSLAGRMLIVGSSGNNGYANENNNYAFWHTGRVVNSAKNVLTVGNVSSAETDASELGLGVPADNSGRGPTYDGRLTPILSAPGDQLKCSDQGTTIKCDPFDDEGITSTAPVSSYQAAQGTSFSTPIVSGAAALLSQTYENSCGTAPKPQDLRALLVHSAKDLTQATGLDAEKIPAGTNLIGPDFVFGYGLVQIDQAAGLVNHTVTAEIESGWVEHRVFLNSDNQLVENAGVQQMRVTLVWDDPPYYAEYPPRAITGILQNDLDLEVIAPSGRRYLPWVLDSTDGNEGNPAQKHSRARLQYVPREYRDHKNTIEQVVLDVPPEMMHKTWTIRVRDYRMRSGPQSYTLVSEMFVQNSGTACGDFSNGVTKRIANPYDLPDTRLGWFLFWLAAIILIWLTFETVLWLYETNWRRFGIFGTLLMVAFVLLLLYGIFQLLHAQEFLLLSALVLVLMMYVLWRARRSS